MDYKQNLDWIEAHDIWLDESKGSNPTEKLMMNLSAIAVMYRIEKEYEST